MLKNINNSDVQAEECQALLRRTSSSGIRNKFYRANYYDQFVRWYKNSSLLRSIFLYSIFNYESIEGQAKLKELLYKITCFLWDAHARENVGMLELQPEEIKQFNQRAKKTIKSLSKFKRAFLQAYQLISPHERIDWGVWERLSRYFDNADLALLSNESLEVQFFELRGILQSSRLYSIDERASFKATVSMLMDRKAITAKLGRKLNQQVGKFCSDRKAGLLYNFITHYGEYLIEHRTSHLSLHSSIWSLNEHKAINTAIKVDNCFREINNFSEELLPAIFYAILIRDIASYYLNSDDRYGSNLSEIFLGIAPNQDVWTTSFGKNNWEMSLILFSLCGMIIAQYWRHSHWHKQMHETKNPEKLLEILHNYEPNFFNDILRWLLPGGMRSLLHRIEMLVMWDNCSSQIQQTTREATEIDLPYQAAERSNTEEKLDSSVRGSKKLGKKIVKVGPENVKRIQRLGDANPLLLGDAIYTSLLGGWELVEEEVEEVAPCASSAESCTTDGERMNHSGFIARLKNSTRTDTITAIFTKLIDFAENAHGFTRLTAISVLGDFVARVDERDFTLLVQYGIDSSIMESRRKQALNALKEISKHSLFAKYQLWKSGNSQQRKLEPIFWLYEFLLLYAKLRVVEAFILWIKDKVDWFIAQYDCYQQQMIFAYMPYSSMWECSLCGDKDIYYKHAFLAQACVDSELRNSKQVEEIIEILNRAAAHGGIKSIDMSRQAWRAWSNKEFSDVLQGIYRASFQKLNFFGLNAAKKAQTALDAKKIEDLCKFLQQVNIQHIDLSGQNFSFNVTASLVEAISAKQLEALNLSGNQIGNYTVSMITELLLRSSDLKELNLSDTGFNDATMEIFVPILRNSTLTTVNFSSNQIGQDGLNFLGNISSTNLRKIKLDHLDFSGLNLAPIGEAIVNNKIDDISISSTRMGDIGFATLVPFLNNSNLKEVQLADNLLSFSSFRFFAHILPFSNITQLNLSGNSLEEEGLFVLANAINNSQVAELSISRCNIGDGGIQAFADTFPYQLTVLDLSNNDISDVGALNLGMALKNSTMTTLNLSYNGLGDDGLLALTTAASSTLRELKLSHNGLTQNAAEHVIKIIQQAPELRVLDLSYNKLNDRGMILIAAELAGGKIVSLDVSDTGISDAFAEAFAAVLPQTKIEQVIFDSNNIGNDGVVQISQSLITAIPHLENIGNAYLKIDEKHAISLAQPATNLRHLSFVDNAIEAEGARALCRILPATNLDFDNLNLVGNPINEQQVNTDICLVSAASRLEDPLGFSQLTSFFHYISHELTSGTSHVFHGLCNLANHMTESLLKSAVQYAVEVVADCPSYFPKDCPAYWSSNTTGLLFSNTHNATNSSGVIGYANLPGIGY